MGQGAPMFGEMPCRCHGSPYDRGDSDAYYGRPYRPHRWLDDMGLRRTADLTPSEAQEYDRGFIENPSGKKDWS